MPDPFEPVVPDIDPDDPREPCPDDLVDALPRRLRFAAVPFFPEELRAVEPWPVVCDDPVPADCLVPPMPPEPEPPWPVDPPAMPVWAIPAAGINAAIAAAISSLRIDISFGGVEVKPSGNGIRSSVSD